MGNSGLGRVPQILIVGPEGAGKTTLVFGETSEETQPTQGYNREEKNFLDKDSQGRRISVWDVSGKEALKPLWSSYYKNILFSAVIFVIDSNDKKNFDNAIRDLHYLTNEEELRDAAFLVLFNMKGSTPNAKGREPKILEILARRHEIHLNTRIHFFEFDFKGYNSTAKDAFEWLYENV